MTDQTFEQYIDGLTDAGKCRFMARHYNLVKSNHMSQARRWRSERRYGAMHARLVSARLASLKAQLALREARRLEAAA